MVKESLNDCFAKSWAETNGGCQEHHARFWFEEGWNAKAAEIMEGARLNQSSNAEAALAPSTNSILIEAFRRAQMKLSAYVGVCKDDKELPKVIEIVSDAINELTCEWHEGHKAGIHNAIAVVEKYGSSGTLNQLLENAALEMRHAMTFISSREKMHPDGVKQFVECLYRILEYKATLPNRLEISDTDAASLENIIYETIRDNPYYACGSRGQAALIIEAIRPYLREPNRE